MTEYVMVPIEYIIESDDYGIPGSTFHYCKLCQSESGAGFLNHGIPHAEDCPVLISEKRSAEPFWYAVVSDEAPIINKAIRRIDVAEEYADKCSESYGGVEVIPLYTDFTGAAQ